MLGTILVPLEESLSTSSRDDAETRVATMHSKPLVREQLHTEADADQRPAPLQCVSPKRCRQVSSSKQVMAYRHRRREG